MSKHSVSRLLNAIIPNMKARAPNGEVIDGGKFKATKQLILTNFAKAVAINLQAGQSLIGKEIPVLLRAEVNELGISEKFSKLKGGHFGQAFKDSVTDALKAAHPQLEGRLAQRSPPLAG